MKEGDKSPTLYSWYDKKYNFDQLQKDADEGVYEYISSLKRGSKDTDQFIKAYSDIMAGIKDGSITFKDGKYVDARGRYSNGLYYDDKGVKQTSKRSSKDYYGLMANYIYGKQRSQNEYTAPEDKTKIKWNGNSSIGQAITRNIFNSDTWNNQDFLDLNEYDEEGKVKGTDKRHQKLYDAFNYVLSNFDNLFTGYSENQKSDATRYIQEAMNYLNDGKIDPGDYLALNRAASGLDYRKMFADKTIENPEIQQDVPETDFVSWVSKKYPIFTGTLHKARSLNDNRTYGQDTLNRITQAVNSLSESDLYRIVRSALADKNYVFNNEQSVINTFGDADYQFSNPFGVRLALQALKDRNLLKSFGSQQPDLYYIPNTDNNQRFTSWVWDSKNGTLSEMSYHDIPSWREKIRAEWQSLKGTQSGDNTYWTSRYGSFKKGGVIKAQAGSNTSDWFSELIDFNPSGYTHQYDTSKLVNADMSNNFDPWVSNIAGKGIGRYLPTKGKTREYTKGIENTQYYQNFKKALINSDGTFTDLGLAWAKLTDALLPMGSKATFFDENNNLRKSWSVNNNDIYGRKPRSFDELEKYVNYVRNDQILGARHNVFLNTGNRYFYKDKNGIKHWVDPSVISKYVVSENPVSSEWNNDRTVYWNDYELTGLKTPNETPEPLEIPETPGNETNINLRIQKQRKPINLSNIQNIIPDLLNAGRLFGSIYTNNKVADVVKKSLTPVLKNTYELYSPVTGAFSEMQLRNSQAADVRRKAAMPFTSDASLQLAGALDANRQATDLERQGFLADDAEIKRTKVESLKRAEDNIARRTDIANFNRASINQTNRELAQLEGTRLKQNWQSIDNFLQGIEGRMRNRQDINKQMLANSQYNQINWDYRDKISEIESDWKIKNPTGTNQDKLNDPEYIRKIREAQRARDTALSNVYYAKHGGSLKPSTIYLINKIIRNENNT